MKTFGILLLLSLLTLWTELQPASGKKSGYPRICPPDPYVCIRGEPNECKRDHDCPGRKICCQNRCAKRCVYPVK